MTSKPKLSSVIKTGDPTIANAVVRSSEFKSGMDAAYAARRGFSIRDVNGEKTMFVSGTRNTTDKILNVTDFIVEHGEDLLEKAATLFGEEFGIPPEAVHKVHQIVDHLSPFDLISKVSSNRLARTAKREGVINVIGHSRGAKLVGDMDINANKAAIDGAMLIAHDKSLRNFAQDRGIDTILAYGGKNNTWLKQRKGLFNQRPDNRHFAYRPPTQTSRKRARFI